MNAEEYLKGLNEHDPVFEIDTEYEYTEQQLINFAERYHEKQLKLLRIGGVVGSLPTEEQIDDKVSRVAASTWGDYGAGYIDGTRNGAYWVIDVINGEDK